MLDDLRYALRMLVKEPGFAAVVVVTLALGLGLNTAMFSLLSALLDLRVPIRDQEQIVNVWSRNLPMGRERSPLSAADFLDYRKQDQVFGALAASVSLDLKLTGGSEPMRLSARQVSDGYFQVLGVEPAIGRSFTAHESAPVAIMSHALWWRRFNGDRAVLGSAITLGGTSYTVIGVMPEGFWFPWRGNVDVWTPLVPDTRQTARSQRVLSVFGRLKPGMTVARAQAEMDGIARQLEQASPASNRGWSVHLIRLQDEIDKRLALGAAFLFGPVFLVLLIACANVANLLLARAAVRAREIAVRAALGAGRFRLIRQLLTESAILALLAGALGLLLAAWGMSFARAYFPNAAFSGEDLRLNMRVLGFALLLCLATPLIFGLVPAIFGTKTDLSGMLKEAGGGHRGGLRSRRLREWLVVAEIGLAVMLLALSGQLIGLLITLERVEPGFDPRNLLVISLGEEGSRPPQLLLDQLRALPGVETAAVADRMPMAAGELRPVLLDGCGSGRTQAAAIEMGVSPGYLAATRIPLRQGGDLRGVDGALVDDPFARRYCSGANPVGAKLRFEDSGGWITVVGLVGEVMHERRMAPSLPHIYVPYTPKPGRATAVLVRTTVPPSSLTAAVRAAILRIDPNQAIESVATMEQTLSEQLQEPRRMITLLAAFATLALALAAIGVYSVMSYTVAQRTHEIGVRIVLGAPQTSVLGLVIRQGMTLAAGGLLGGLMIAAGLAPLSHELRSSPGSMAIRFAAVALVLGAVALLACYVPARRAARVEPMVALRHE